MSSVPRHLHLMPLLVLLVSCVALWRYAEAIVHVLTEGVPP